METLKSFITTLVTVLIFMSAVELMAPNNKMKKYIKFVLGLILVTVILNPILEFICKGESSVINVISEYTTVFSQEKKNINSEYSNILNGDEKRSKDDTRKKSFVDNFNKNCESLLKNKFPDKKFQANIDCDVDFTDIRLNVKKLCIGVGSNDKKINPIKKVQIGNDSKEETSNYINEEFKEIRDYASSELEIPKDKIDVYKIDE